MRLLLVEDNPLISQAIEKAGQRLDLQIDIATDGWDAIEKLRTESYGGVVVDADLPRHSGYGVLTYLRQENGDEFDNVVVMTSNDYEVLRHRVSETLQVILKSAAVDELADGVAAVFRS